MWLRHTFKWYLQRSRCFMWYYYVSITSLACRMLGNVWNARCFGQFYMKDGPYAHSSMTGKVAGTSVIPYYLAHWHTSTCVCAKLYFQTWVQPMYYSSSVWKLVNQVRWLEAARHWCVVGCVGCVGTMCRMQLVPVHGYPNCEYRCLCVGSIPHPWSLLMFRRCSLSRRCSKVRPPLFDGCTDMEVYWSRHGKLAPMESQLPFNGTTVISKIGH